MVGVRKQPWSSLSSDEKLLGAPSRQVWKKRVVFREVADILNERIQWKDLADVLPTIDIVILACVQNSETKGMINAEFLMQCK